MRTVRNMISSFTDFYREIFATSQQCKAEFNICRSFLKRVKSPAPEIATCKVLPVYQHGLRCNQTFVHQIHKALHPKLSLLMTVGCANEHSYAKNKNKQR